MYLFDASIFAAMYFDQAIDYYNRNRFAEAIHDFDKCLEYRPYDRLAHWYKAMALLALGDYQKGFAEHEYRWQAFDWRWGLLGEDVERLKSLPLWRGESLKDKRIILHHEQGFGDAIMCLRYIPVLKQRGAQLTALMPEPLRRLVVEQFNIEVINEVPEWPLQHFDYRCGLFDVMLPLQQTIATIPGAPYLFADNWWIKGDRIGIAWSGRSRQELTLDYFLEYLDGLSGFELYALQFAEADKRLHMLQSKDFTDTLHLIARMNHIITVDTAVAHLAGAMGHPSQHLVLPWNTDWRWYNAKVWYPSLNIYRQAHPRDWAGPFAQVKNALLRNRS